MVDRSEPDVGNIIDVLETMENIFSDAFRGNSFLVGCPFVLQFVYDLFYTVVVHASFIKCHKDAAVHLGAIVEVFLAVGFRHEEVDELESFECSEPSLAFLAFASSSDGLTVFGHTGIDNFGVEIFAFRTAHDRGVSG